MSYFVKANKIGIWHPDFVASDVLDIDYSFLAKNGTKAIAFDVDGTLTVNNSHQIDTKRAQKLNNLLDKAGIKKRYLASNSIRNLDEIIQKLPGFEAHQPHKHSGKPSRNFYRQLIKRTGVKPAEITMIGDRALQDTWAAQRMGLNTVLVELNPDFCNLKDKIILRHIWQKYFVMLKKSKNA